MYDLKVGFFLILFLLCPMTHAEWYEFDSGNPYTSECQEYLHTGQLQLIASRPTMSLSESLNSPYVAMPSIKLHHRLVKAQITYSMYFVLSLRVMGQPPENLHTKTKDELKDIAKELYRFMSYRFNRNKNDFSLNNHEKTKDLFFKIPEDILTEKLFETLIAFVNNGEILNADGSKWLRPFYLFKIRRHQLQAEQSKNLALTSSTPTAFLKLEQENLRDSVKKISDRTSGLELQLYPSLSLLTFGTDVLNHHKQLIKVYTHDFLQWMPVYDSQINKIRQNLNRIRLGEDLKTSTTDFEFRTLLQLFLEAAEGTRMTLAVSSQISDSLESHLAELRQIDKSTLSGVDLTDYTRKSNTLSIALISQRQFAANLEAVYNVISAILNGLDQLDAAETSLAIKHVGSHGVNHDVQKIADGLLVDLDHMDSSVGDLLPALSVEPSQVSGPEKSAFGVSDRQGPFRRPHY